MGAFEQFAYTNYHDMNLDWILQTVKQDKATVDNITSVWATMQAEVEQMLTTQTNILDEAKAYADGAASSVTAAQQSATAAANSANSAGVQATQAAGSATQAATSLANIGNTAETVINKASQMDVVYNFFQSISSNISSSSDIQTAAEQIALAVANTLIIDGGDPGSVASNIIDGGAL